MTNKLQSNVKAVYPLTPLQAGMLYHDTLSEDLSYTDQFIYRLNLGVEEKRLRRAFNLLIARHEALRCFFLHDGLERPLQVILELAEVNWRISEWQVETEENFQQKLKELANHERNEGFDLSQAPLFKVNFINSNWGKYLIFTFHHIILDGWCMDLIFSDLETYYSQLAFLEPAQLLKKVQSEALSHPQYGDYLRYITSQDQEKSQAYWQGLLAPVDSNVHFQCLGEPEKQKNACEETICFSPAISKKIQELATSWSITPSTIIEGLLALTAFRENSGNELVFGKTTSGRQVDFEGAEEIVGLFINTLPVYTNISQANQKARNWLEDLQMQANTSLSYLAPSLSELKKNTGLGNDLLSYLYVFENYDSGEEETGLLGLTTIAAIEQTNQPISFAAYFDEVYKIKVLYYSNFYTSQDIQRYSLILSAMIDILDEEKSLIDLLTVFTPQDQALYDQIFALPTDYEKKSFLSCFEETVELYPDKIALEDSQASYTYRELDHLSDLAAGALINAGIRRGEVVGLAIEKSAAFFLWLIATAKCGACFLALDSALPQDRLNFMLSDAKAKIIVHDRNIDASLGSDCAKLDLRSCVLEKQEVHPDINKHKQEARENLDDPLYIIFTSGSTGQPKGVEMSSQAFASLRFHAKNDLGVVPADRVLQFANTSFDASLFDVANSFFTGATLVVCPSEASLDLKCMEDFLRKKQVTVAVFPPHFLNQLSSEAIGNLRLVMTAGSATNLPLVERVRAMTSYINEYGPTETAIAASFWRAPSSGVLKEPLPIGKAISGKQLVLQRYGRLAPYGTPGELLIGGNSHFTGYLGNEDKTKASLIKLEERPEGPLFYKSGDLARFLPNGNLQFFGRIDRQVKIRGFRIELAEIEGQLLAQKGVENAAAVAREQSGDVRLYAYLVGKKGASLDLDAIKQKLMTKLPSYMVPQHFMQVATLPLKASGKLDISNLPLAEVETQLRPPETPQEILVAKVFSQVLNADPIGKESNYYSLGGDSIKAMRMVSLFRQVGLTISIQDILNYQTVEAIAAAAGQQVESSYTQEDWSGIIELSPLQNSFLNEWQLENPNYSNMAFSFELDCDSKTVAGAVAKVVREHEMLRAKLTKGKIEVVDPQQALPYCFFDRNFKSVDELQAEIVRLQASLDLCTLTSIFLHYRCEENEDQGLVCIFHHFFVDYYSLTLIEEDLKLALAGKEIARRTLTYPSWLEKTEKFYASEGQQERRYWDEILRVMPSTEVRSEVEVGDFRVDIDSSDSAALLELAEFYNCSLQELLLVALSHSLQQDFVVMLESHGRSDAEALSHTIAWFTALYPLKLNYEGDLIRQLLLVKEQMRDVPRNGVGFGFLYDSLLASPVCFNYLGESSGSSSNLDEALAEVMADQNTLPFQQSINAWLEDGCLCITLNQNGKEVYITEPSLRKALNGLLAQAKQTQEEVKQLQPVQYQSISTSDLLALKQKVLIPNAQLEQVFPATPLQEGMLFHTVKDESQSYYVEQVVITIKDRASKEAAYQAFYGLCKRYPMLRSSLAYADNFRAYNLIFSENDDIRTGKLDPQLSEQDALNQWVSTERQNGFRPGEDLFFRGLYLTAPEERAYIILSFHHAIADGWSLEIVLNGYVDLYASYYQEVDFVQPCIADAVSYKEFISYLDRQNHTEARLYWSSLTERLHEICQLPSMPRATDQFQEEQKSLQLDLSAEETTHIRDLAKACKTTPNVVIEVALALALRSYIYDEYTVFGKIVSGRQVPFGNVTETVGLFINTIPVVYQVALEKSLRDLIRQGQLQAEAGLRYDFYSLADIQKDSALGADLIRILYSFENFYGVHAEAEAIERNVDYETVHEKADTDLSLMALEDETYHLRAVYRQRCFSQIQIQNLLEQMRLALVAMCKNPDQTVGTLDLLTEKDKEYLATLNSDKAELPFNSVVQSFCESCLTHPDRPAIVTDDREYSYREFGLAVCSLAETLKKRDIGKEDIVAVHLAKSYEYVVSMYAIMLAGAAYLPLDVAAPLAQKEYVLANAKAALLIGRPEDTFAGIDTLVFDDALSKLTTAKADPDFASFQLPQQQDLAYMIYTSGSTGKPKGVMLEHAGLVNLLLHSGRAYRVTPEDVILHFANPVFDASVWEITMTIPHGACLAIPSQEILQDARRLGEFVEQKGVTIAAFPPNYLRELDREKLRGLRLLVTGGSAAKADLIEAYSQNCDYVNEYGPSEVTCSATYYLQPDGEKIPSPIPLGRPIVNKEIYIWKDGHICGIGQCGEIVITGAGLARAYLGEKEKTLAAFREDILPGKRCYCTGDMGMLTADGQLLFLGRRDHQVKIHGFRIELEAITHEVKKLPGVKEAITIVRECEGDQGIICFATADAPFNEDDMLSELTQHMPHYMIPRRLVYLTDFTLNSSGKINRNALPDINLNRQSAFELPVTPAEKAVAEAFKNVLQVKQVGRRDNFFRLGGHSLKITGLLNLLEADFGFRPRINEIYQYPTVTSLANQLELTRTKGLPEVDTLTKAESRVTYPLSQAEQRIYQVQELFPGSCIYNMPLHMAFQGFLDHEKLKRSFIRILELNSNLRTAFILENGQPVQKITPLSDLKIPFEYYPESLYQTSGLTEVAYVEQIYKNFVRAFDLSQAPLLRLAVHEIGGNSHIFLDMHHIIMDGESLNLFLTQLSELYAGGEETGSNFQFSDYAVWEVTHDHSREGEYWLDSFTDMPELLDLASDFVRPPVKSQQGAFMEISAPVELSQRLRNQVSEWGVTDFSYLLAAYFITASHFSNQEDLVVGIPTSGRNLKGLEDVMGMFVNTLALRSKPQAQKTVADFVREVHAIIGSALANQSYPYEQLIEDLKLERDFSRNPLFDIFFVMQNSNMKVELFPGHPTIPSLLPPRSYAHYDLTLNCIYQDGQYDFTLEYDTALFLEETARRFLTHLLLVLESMLDQPKTELRALPRGRREELDQALAWGTGPYLERSGKETFVSYFREMCHLYPENTAIKSTNSGSFTYKEMELMTNQVGQLLLAKGLKRGEIVGLRMHKSPMYFIAALGVMKAGGAFVSLDRSLPSERMNYIMRDAAIRFVLTDDEMADSPEFIQISTSVLSDYASNDPDLFLTSEDLAYLIYTSGTSGRPKGVLLSHDGIASLRENFHTGRSLGAGDKVLQFFSTLFDAHIAETAASLLSGACLYILNEEEQRDMEAIQSILDNEEINAVFLPTSIARLLDLNKLRMVVTAGSASSQQLVERFNGNYYNEYGPSEATVLATAWQQSNLPSQSRIPIGRPTYNKRLLVLQEDQICASGLPGELAIAGDGLAVAYLNDPDKTQASFTQIPGYQGRIYRTGDLVRMRPDGQLEWLRRLDQQVKLRGFRIELGEIEEVLRKVEGISDAAVAIQNKDTDTAFLAAYLVGDAPLDQVKAEVMAKLPSYMQPVAYGYLDKLPLNASGKLDRSQLVPLTPVKAAYSEPENKQEVLVAQAFTKVLATDHVGRDSDFLGLGGDSIKAIQLVSELRKQGYSIKVAQVLSSRTVRAIAHQLEKVKQTFSQEPIVGSLDLSPLMQDFLCEWPFADPWHFNQSVLIPLDRKWKENEFRAQVAPIFELHDMLRAVYRDGKLSLRSPQENSFYSFRTLVSDDLDEIQKAVDNLQSSFDPGTYLQAFLQIEYRSYNYLLWSCHHILVDAVSWNILKDDLKLALAGKALPEKTASYQDWEHYLTELATQDDEVGEYHKKMELTLKQQVPGNNLEEQSLFDCQLCLSQSLTSKLEKLSESSLGLKAEEILLAAVVQAWGCDLSVALEDNGRNINLDLSRSVGWFTSVYPVYLSYTQDLLDQLIQVKETLRTLPRNIVSYQFLPTKQRAEISFNYFGKAQKDCKSEISEQERYLDELPLGQTISEKNYFPYQLAVNAEIDTEGALNLNLLLRTDTKSRQTDFVNRLQQVLEEIAKTSWDTDFKTVSDVAPDLELDADILAELNNLADLFS